MGVREHASGRTCGGRSALLAKVVIVEFFILSVLNYNLSFSIRLIIAPRTRKYDNEKKKKNLLLIIGSNLPK